MQNLRIGTRIYLIVVLLVIGLLILGVGYFKVTGDRARLDEAVRAREPITRVVDDLRQGLPDMKLQTTNLLIPDLGMEELKEQSGDVAQIKKDFADFLKDWDENAAEGATPAEKAGMEKLRGEISTWMKSVDQFMVYMSEYIATGDPEARAKAFAYSDQGELDVTHNAFEESLASFIKLTEKNTTATRSSAIKGGTDAASWLAAGTGAGLLLVLITAALVAASIRAPLAEAIRFAEAVAAGDLSATMGVTSRSEIGDMTRAVERMKETLVNRVEQMREVAATVELAAEGVTETAEAVVEEAHKAGNESLAEKGQALAAKAGNLTKALSAFDQKS